MPVMISPDDPAGFLLQRVNISDLEKVWDLLQSTPVKVGEVAERLGIEVLSVTLPIDVSGLIRKNEEGHYEIQINNTDAAVRQRFTVCHEIAHYLLHRQLIDAEGITDSILYRSKLSNKQEVEANKLGAAILLPWHVVSAWHESQFGTPPHKVNLDAIAAAFRASTLAVGFRLGI